MGNRVKILLKNIGISQKKFAESIGLSPNSITEVVSGRVQNFSLEILSIISRLYNVNLHWLLTGEGDIFLSKNPENQGDFSTTNIHNGIGDIVTHNYSQYMLNEDESIVIDNLRKRKNADKMPIVKAVLGIK